MSVLKLLFESLSVVKLHEVWLVSLTLMFPDSSLRSQVSDEVSSCFSTCQINPEILYCKFCWSEIQGTSRRRFATARDVLGFFRPRSTILSSSGVCRLLETVINSASVSQRGSAVEDREISGAGDWLSEHRHGRGAGTQRHFEGHALVWIHSNLILQAPASTGRLMKQQQT